MHNSRNHFTKIFKMTLNYIQTDINLYPNSHPTPSPTTALCSHPSAWVGKAKPKCDTDLQLLIIFLTKKNIVAESKRYIYSPKLSTIEEHGHPINRWSLHAKLCICSEIFLQSNNSVQTLQRFLRWGYKPSYPACIHMQKDHIQTLKILQSMSVWWITETLKNNPAWTKKTKKC